MPWLHLRLHCDRATFVRLLIIEAEKQHDPQSRRLSITSNDVMTLIGAAALQQLRSVPSPYYPPCLAAAADCTSAPCSERYTSFSVSALPAAAAACVMVDGIVGGLLRCRSCGTESALPRFTSEQLIG